MSNVPLVVAVVVFFGIVHFLFSRFFYENATIRNKLKPPPPHPCMMCVAFWRALFMPDATYVHSVGVDAMVFVEFNRLVIKCLASFAFWALAVDMSVYIAAARGYLSYVQVTNATGLAAAPEGVLPSSSLANVPQVENSEIWYNPAQLLSYVFSLLGMWFNTFYVIWSMERSWKRVVKWCHADLAGEYDDEHEDDKPAKIAAHAIIVRTVDPTMPLVTQEMAMNAWRALFPKQLYSVRMVQDTGVLPKLITHFEKSQAALAKLEKKGAHPSVIDAAKITLDAARAKVLAARNAVTQEISGLAYFVVFRTARAATIAQQISSLPPSEFEVLPCPCLSAIDWGALRPLSVRFRPFAHILARVLYVVMLMFWSVPIAAVSTLNNLDELAKYSPELRDTIEGFGPAGNGFFRLLPTLLLFSFNYFLPYICRFTAQNDGHVGQGKTEAASYSDLFIFQYTWTFLGVAIGTSLVGALYAFVNNPSGALVEVSTGLANATTFFMTYEVLGLVPFLGLYLSRIIAVCKACTKHRLGLLADGQADDEPAQYQYFWARISLSCTIGICLGSISPLTTVFSLTSVCISALVYKKNLLYSYTHAAEDRGSFFPYGVGHITLIFVTAQVVLFMLHASKLSWYTAAAMMPLPFLTYSAHRRNLAFYEPKMKRLPLATHLSAVDGVRPTSSSSDREYTDEALAEALGTSLMQPELVHPAVMDGSRMTQLIERACAAPSAADHKEGGQKVEHAAAAGAGGNMHIVQVGGPRTPSKAATIVQQSEQKMRV